MSYHRFYFNCQFSVLTLLRRLFLLAARHSVQAPSALAPQRRLNSPLLLHNSNRENQIAWADVVNHINALHNLAEAGVYAVEVLGVLAAVADEEL